MESFIRQQNILHYRQLLTNVTDETERQTVLKLLGQKQQDDGDLSKAEPDDSNRPQPEGVLPRLNVGQGSYLDYQQYAEECLRWADEADSEQHRELFLSMARAWTQADLILKGVMVPKEKDEFESLPQLEGEF